MPMFSMSKIMCWCDTLANTSTFKWPWFVVVSLWTSLTFLNPQGCVQGWTPEVFGSNKHSQLYFCMLFLFCCAVPTCSVAIFWILEQFGRLNKHEISAGKFQVRPMNTICPVFSEGGQAIYVVAPITQWNENIISVGSSPEGLGWKYKKETTTQLLRWSSHHFRSICKISNHDESPPKFCMYTLFHHYTPAILQIMPYPFHHPNRPNIIPSNTQKNPTHVGTSHVSLCHDLLPGAVAKDQSWSKLTQETPTSPLL